MEIIFIISGFGFTVFLSWFCFRGFYSRYLSNSPEKYSELEKLNAILTEKVSANNLQNQKLQQELNLEREKFLSAQQKVIRADEAYKYINEKVASQKEEIENIQKRLTSEFESIASRLLEEKSLKFTEQNKNNIDIILNPLKERIKEFEEKVDKTYKVDSEERISLKTEIKGLVDLNKQLSEEANNLAKALKGDNKKQGNWGEMILEKLLERSGLTKGIEYKSQVFSTGDHGRRIQPDVVIYLPENKHLIVDSKVSLIAYESFINAQTQSERDFHIRDHLNSLREHIKGLSEKNYSSGKDFNSPEFVILFVPIESSFSVAIQADQELFNFAWERKVVIVSPTTLLATLLTISSIWKQEKQNKNAQEIAVQSGLLYEKFVGFIEDLSDIGIKLDASKKSYQDAFNKLSLGNGNIVKKVQKLKELGAKTQKSIPEQYFDAAEIQPKSLEK